MDKILETVANALLVLRQASASIHNEYDFRIVIQKYNIMFLGEHFNVINTIELSHSLETVFNLSVSNEELLSIIPIVCNNLNMKFEGLKSIEDLSNPNPHAYSITLY